MAPKKKTPTSTPELRQLTLFDCWKRAETKQQAQAGQPLPQKTMEVDDEEDEDDKPLVDALPPSMSSSGKRVGAPESLPEAKKPRGRPKGGIGKKETQQETQIDENTNNGSTGAPALFDDPQPAVTPCLKADAFEDEMIDALTPACSTATITPAPSSGPNVDDVTLAPRMAPPTMPAASSSSAVQKVENRVIDIAGESEDDSARNCQLPGVGQEQPPSAADAHQETSGVAPQTENSEEPKQHLGKDETADLSATQIKLQREGMNPFAAECFYNYYLSCGDYEYPSWLKAENLRDAQGRRPDDPNYDQKTLWIPSPEVQKSEKAGTPMLLQYWQVKTKHFDQIAFVKVGKFYEIFYLDAMIAQRVCGLKWMGSDRKPHVGFPEVALHANARKLVDAGYMVCVVEQVETVEEARARTEKGVALVKRDTCEVFTRGTIVHHDMVGVRDNNYLAVIWFGSLADTSHHVPSPYDFAVILIDTCTGDARVGAFKDDVDRNALRTLMAQVQPREILYHPLNVAIAVQKMLKRIPCQPLLNPWVNMPSSVPMAEIEIGRFNLQLPDDIKEKLKYDPVTIVIGASFGYLKSVLLDEQIVPFMKWSVYDPFSVKKHMMLDATALTNLEIVETQDGQEKGSLLHFLDHTSTPLGFRLFKRWLCAPLLQIDEINTRLDSVEFFQKNFELRDKVKKALARLPDLERMCNRTSAFGVQSERQAVLYGDMAGSRLRNFLKLLDSFDEAQDMISLLSCTQGMPELLSKLVKLRPEGMFPDVKALTKVFRSRFVMTNSDKGQETFRPRDGVFEDYDAPMREVAQMEEELEQILYEFRQRFPKATFSLVSRMPAYRFEIEVPENDWPKNILHSQEIDITSKKTGFFRFQTPQMKQLIIRYEASLQKAKDAMYPFMGSLFKEFHSYSAEFTLAINVIAEIDVFISMSIVGDSPYGPMMRPEFVEVGPNDEGVLEMLDSRHPVAEAHANDSFVPNDIKCGGSPEAPPMLLVTGPNMGGKSTVLRQTCLNVIMAQIGCKVSAARCRLTPVDRIFTRVGAQDSLIEGKSTFLMELEETSSILHFATRRSLAVIDELGRGTSTFDGAAIALATLDHMAQKIQCRCLFATHYHLLSTYQSPLVTCYHMACHIDEETNDLHFLYKFVQGLCPDSHGHNVAKLAGLPEIVTSMAKQKSIEFRTSHNVQGAKFVMAEIQRLAKAQDEEGLVRLLMNGKEVAGSIIS